jgi:hypothetical protein
MVLAGLSDPVNRIRVACVSGFKRVISVHMGEFT